MFRGKETLYYVIYLDISDMTVMIPVDKSDEMGIRAIVPQAEAEICADVLIESDLTHLYHSKYNK